MKPDKNKVFRVKGKVQHYAWGGVSFLPRLLNIPNPEQKPFAEYWLGAHDNGTAEMILPDKSEIGLNEYIRSFPIATLGSGVVNQFGKLPYLLKILDVNDMLSIQVHPSKKDAEKEFADENTRGIALDAAHRNYQDDNHKPELMVALSEFWLLHGFKPQEQLIVTLQKIPELNFLAPVFEKGYAALYRMVMQMDQQEVNKILQPLLDKIIPLYRENRLEKSDDNFWAARAALTFNEPNRIDRGIFSIYFFNLLQLNPGEGIFQDAGLPHAYLEGQNIEIMANSDNVLRGGLTSKHIDVNELMKHIHFESTVPSIINEEIIQPLLGFYRTPAPDFRLNKMGMKKGDEISLLSYSTQIFMVLKGKIDVHENDKNTFLCNTGEAWLSFDKAAFRISAVEDAVVYYACVPY